MFKLSLTYNIIKDIVHIKLVYGFVVCQTKHIYFLKKLMLAMNKLVLEFCSMKYYNANSTKKKKQRRGKLMSWLSCEVQYKRMNTHSCKLQVEKCFNLIIWY
jgi:hypothetical protein